MTAAGEVWERDGETRRVLDVCNSSIGYLFQTSSRRGIAYAWQSEWDAWAAGAKRVEKESDDDSKS